jgi:hypothetical protein
VTKTATMRPIFFSTTRQVTRLWIGRLDDGSLFSVNVVEQLPAGYVIADAASDFNGDGHVLPVQNGFIESFNGRLRDECLNEHLFTNLNEARQIIEEWRIDYNTNRSHTSLNGLTPTEFATTTAKHSARPGAELNSARLV